MTHTKKMWHIFKMEHYSAMKKEDILPFSTTWMGLEHIMKVRETSTVFHLYVEYKKIKFVKNQTKPESKMVVTRG